MHPTCPLAMVLTTIQYLFLVSGVLVYGKPNPVSNPNPAPWDWQEEEQVDYAKYTKYEEEMKKMLEQPYFARVNNKTTVKLGKTAFLPCRVKEMLKDYTVTWMRLSDVTILSVGSMEFSSDPRYGLVHIHR